MARAAARRWRPPPGSGPPPPRRKYGLRSRGGGEGRRIRIEPLRRGRGHDVEAAEDLGHDLAAVEPEKGGLIVQGERPSERPLFSASRIISSRGRKKGRPLGDEIDGRTRPKAQDAGQGAEG